MCGNIAGVAIIYQVWQYIMCGEVPGVVIFAEMQCPAHIPAAWPKHRLPLGQL